MNRYLVGGAVRDQLLGLPEREQDWLLTDTSAAQLQQLGYRPVGRDFTVFLHPETHQECALPRASGADEQTQVEQDLQHRDLTINAMARAADGRLIDPLGGQQDLAARRLRHTPAFGEDPIRVLRLARFAARLAPQGFQIDPQTRRLAQQMVSDGALDRLVPERVWAEIDKALQGPRPRRFIEALRECHALAVVLPELERLFGIPQPPIHHPEIDSGEHSLLSLQRACELSDSVPVRLSALLHDIGKGATPAQQWPSHIGHEARGGEMIEAIGQRLRLPNAHRRLACQVARLHTDCHRVLTLRPATLLKRLTTLGALRRHERLQPFLLACTADFRGRTGYRYADYPQAAYLQQLLQAADAVDSAAVARSASSPQQISQRITDARLRALSEVRSAWRQQPQPR